MKRLSCTYQQSLFLILKTINILILSKKAYKKHEIKFSMRQFFWECGDFLTFYKQEDATISLLFLPNWSFDKFQQEIIWTKR